MGLTITIYWNLKVSGIDGVAVISALFAQENTGEATRKILDLCMEVVNG